MSIALRRPSAMLVPVPPTRSGKRPIRAGSQSASSLAGKARILPTSLKAVSAIMSGP